MHYQKLIGKFGENIAERYLFEHNYTILHRNFYCKNGEIDIIAKDNSRNEIVFFEVKTRTNYKFGTPIESINTYKCNRILKSARYYLHKNELYDFPIRLDAIEVFLYDDYYILKHLLNIF